MQSPLDLTYPFNGRWLVQNSPANRVPSHGTSLFGSSFAIDFVPLGEGRSTAPFTFGSLLRSEPPGVFPGFGRRVLSPAVGTVVAVHDSAADHRAHRGLPSVGYALSQRRRVSGRWQVAAGNHVMIESHGVIIAICHLQHESVEVEIGQHLEIGAVLARCGNSGNSTEPHVHVQAFDRQDVESAKAVPLVFSGQLPKNGAVIET